MKRCRRHENLESRHRDWIAILTQILIKRKKPSEETGSFYSYYMYYITNSITIIYTIQYIRTNLNVCLLKTFQHWSFGRDLDTSGGSRNLRTGGGGGGPRGGLFFGGGGFFLSPFTISLFFWGRGEKKKKSWI